MRLLPLLLMVLLVPRAVAGLRDVGFDEQPGARLPLAVLFWEDAHEVRLERFFGTAPVVLQLGYGDCVHLCSTTQRSAAQALSRAGLVAGRDYIALFVSIDPRDERSPIRSRDGWHMLTGASSAAALARSIGFRYRYDEDSGEFSHPAGFVIATPDGAVSSYVTGVSFDPETLRAAIGTAGRGARSSLFERVLLVCFHDPVTGRYSEAILWTLRVAAAAFLATIALSGWRRLR